MAVLALLLVCYLVLFAGFSAAATHTRVSDRDTTLIRIGKWLQTASFGAAAQVVRAIVLFPLPPVSFSVLLPPFPPALCVDAAGVAVYGGGYRVYVCVWEC